MPCMDAGPSPEQERLDAKRREQAEADRHVMARLACDYCRLIERGSESIPAWAQDWWKRHKKDDDKRIRREAIAKLTPEERRVLGIK